jgi:hypothetical protein
MGFPADHGIVRELENDLKWSMRRCPVRFLARAIYGFSTGRLDFVEGEGFGIASSPKSSGRSIEKFGAGHPIFTAIQSLQRRWTEVTTGSEFISTFRVINHLPSETREKLEDRAVEMVEDFSLIEMVKVCIYMYKLICFANNSVFFCSQINLNLLIDIFITIDFHRTLRAKATTHAASKGSSISPIKEQ